MLLREFLVTRVVELVVHGFDLALALGREPWLSEAGARVVLQLLIDDSLPSAPTSLGLDRTTFLLKATGRAPFTVEERDRAAGLGVRWLTLG